MFVEYPTASSPSGADLRAAPGPARLDGPSRPPGETPQWRGRDVGLGLALAALSFFGILGIASAIIAFRDFRTGSDELNATLLTATALLELSLGAIVLLLARARGMSWAAIGFRRPRSWGPLVVAWFGAYFILTLWAAALAVVRELGVDTSRVEGGNTLPIESSDPVAALVVLGVSVIVFAPFCEELFFRSLIYRGLRHARSIATALLVSGLLFGAFHFSLSVLLPFAGVGVLFAWANDRTGSLWTSIIAHALFNGVAFTISIVAARGSL